MGVECDQVVLQALKIYNMSRDMRFDILTSVDSDEALQPSF